MICNKKTIIFALASNASALKTSSKGIGIYTNPTPAPRLKPGIDIDALLASGRNGLDEVSEEVLDGLNELNEEILDETELLENVWNEGANEAAESLTEGFDIFERSVEVGTNKVDETFTKGNDIFERGVESLEEDALD